MKKPSDTYTVNIILRGLVLARPTSAGLAILLPDGTSPTRIPRPEGAAPVTTNEHFGVLEFFQDDWQNPTTLLPETIHVTKPTKAPVAITFLGSQRESRSFCDLIRLDTLRGTAPVLPDLSQPHYYNTTFQGVADSLKVLDKQSENSFRELPPFTGEPVDLAWQRAVACSLIPTGEVVSERRSKKLGSDEDLEWFLPSLGEVEALLTGGLTLPPRPINLDIRVRFEVSRLDSLVISLVGKDRLVEEQFSKNLRFLPTLEGDPGARLFILKPQDPDLGLTIWIKNRELKRIFLDSDLLPDPFGTCGEALPADWDHALFGNLVASQSVPQIQIPVPADTRQSDCGAACGCKG